MDVYYNGNGNTWGKGRKSEKLTAFPAQKTFLWENLDVFIPTVYTGKSGAILDVCIKISVEDMAAFLKKWNREKRLSLHTNEDFEQMEKENPCCIDFEADMRLNDEPLKQRMRASLVWYPEEVYFLEESDEFTPAARSADMQDADAEKLMTAYHCDRNFCWYFGRLVYNWNNEPVLFPQKVSLVLKAMPEPVTAAHFTTNLSCSDEKVKIIHPATGQEYVLTLHECEETEIPFSGFGGAKGMCYPKLCQKLSYSISPKPEQNSPDILDCTNSDQPRRETASGSMITQSCGPTAIFAAGKGSLPDLSVAFSSLHFEPVQSVRWRAVFQMKPREDAVLSFPCLSL